MVASQPAPIRALQQAPEQPSEQGPEQTPKQGPKQVPEQAPEQIGPVTPLGPRHGDIDMGESPHPTPPITQELLSDW